MHIIIVNCYCTTISPTKAIIHKESSTVSDKLGRVGERKLKLKSHHYTPVKRYAELILISNN